MKRRVMVSVVLLLGIFLVGSVIAVQGLQGHRRHAISGDVTSKIISNERFIGDLKFGHPNSEIIVNVKGNVGKLSDLYSTLKSTASAGESPANYTGNPLAGKQFVTADTIYITSKGEEKSLQKAINDGDFYFPCACTYNGGCQQVGDLLYTQYYYRANTLRWDCRGKDGQCASGCKSSATAYIYCNNDGSGQRILNAKLCSSSYEQRWYRMDSSNTKITL